jgi:predicted alpha/beta superfamily hydrolase
MRLPIVCLFTLLAAAAHGQFKIIFNLSSPDLADTSSVYITGSHTNIGGWDPAKVKMEYKGQHVWTKEVLIDRAMNLEYKYTLGSWQREGADAAGAPLPNFQIRIGEDKMVNDQVLFWTSGRAARSVHGKITGDVRYHRQLKGTAIDDRDVIVWLPPGYEKENHLRYPVVYMHDGQNIFDPATSAFGTDWRIDETADSLIKLKAIPAAIIVGIYNTAARMKEYTPGDKGSAYMNFVVKKVKPFIDSVYRTKPDRDNTITGGSSAGGILSFMLVWEYPQIFSKAICMSPAFRPPAAINATWNYITTVKHTSQPPKNVFFYMDNGGVGLDADLQPGIDEMLVALKEKGYKENKDFVFILDASARHFESEWAKRFPEAIKMVLSK